MRVLGKRYSVVIKLNERSDLCITTSAAHALSIINGETLFAVASTEVFDSDGNGVAKEELERTLATEEQRR